MPSTRNSALRKTRARSCVCMCVYAECVYGERFAICTHQNPVRTRRLLRSIHVDCRTTSDGTRLSDAGVARRDWHGHSAWLRTTCSIPSHRTIESFVVPVIPQWHSIALVVAWIAKRPDVLTGAATWEHRGNNRKLVHASDQQEKSRSRRSAAIARRKHCESVGGKKSGETINWLPSALLNLPKAPDAAERAQRRFNELSKSATKSTGRKFKLKLNVRGAPGRAETWPIVDVTTKREDRQINTINH